MSRVMIAMSGGVDSSVAAALLVEEGHEVVGATLRLLGDDWSAQASEVAGEWASQRAEEVCAVLGIPHHTVDAAAQFAAQVIEYFCAEYEAGRTPNPCLRCNQLIKWGVLLPQAQQAGCDYLATGHYAIIDRQNQRHVLRRGRDSDKDQSYMLYNLSQPQLAHTLLPLGEYTKQQVRQIASDLGLPVTANRESQDICFIPEGDYRQFLQGRVDFESGLIKNAAGQIVGTHPGLPAYTVGQRHGLGISGGPPVYVVAKDVEENALIVGGRSELWRRKCKLEELNWISIAPPSVGQTINAQVQLRYRARCVDGTVTLTGSGSGELSLAPHKQAVSPGQAAVFYRQDLLLGGGIIGS